jgi:hypothetical protein
LGGLSENLTDHIIDPKDPYETNYIGGGLPPIETLRMVVNLPWCK